MKKQYKFGDCIPYSLRIYDKLKRKGYNPLIVEGWVEVDTDKALDILPDKEALELYFPDLANEYFNKGNEFSDYPKLLQHTWLILDNKIIDITKNQFDIYGGIKEYYIKEKYYYKGSEEIVVLV